MLTEDRARLDRLPNMVSVKAISGYAALITANPSSRSMSVARIAFAAGSNEEGSQREIVEEKREAANQGGWARYVLLQKEIRNRTKGTL